MKDQRLEHEIAHGKILREIWEGKLAYWETPAGKLRWKRRLRMLSSHITPNMKVLEIGCGVGYFTKEIASLGANVTAIDISPDLLDVARKEVSHPDVTFKIENAYNLSFSNNTFDTIIGSSILHHLEVNIALKEFYRVLKKGGEIFFTEPNMANPQIFLQKNVPLFKRLAGDSPDETAFLRYLLKKDFHKHGFNKIDILPFDFLHPSTPPFFIPFVKSLGDSLEKTPFLKEIAGSLYIQATKESY